FRAELLDALAQRASEPHEVLAFLLKNDEPGRIGAVDPERAVDARGRDLDVGDVTQQHRPRGIDPELAERRDAAGAPVEHDLPAAAVPLGAAEIAEPLHGSAEVGRASCRAGAEVSRGRRAGRQWGE